MPDERRLSISSLSRMSADEVGRHTFGTVRRGFDPAEVRAFLEDVAGELRAAAERERELQDAVRDAEHRAANPVLDEATLSSALGQETARVLRSAHDASAELVARGRSEAEELERQAAEQAAALRAEAEAHAAEQRSTAEHDAAKRRDAVEAEAAEVLRRARDEAAEALDAAHRQAEALLTSTRDECRSMVHEAQQLRSRLLGDLTQRRRVLRSQIDQLRAGRHQLAEVVAAARRDVDRIADELFRAEDEARRAAEAAADTTDTEEEVDISLDDLLRPLAAPAEAAAPGSAGAVEPPPASADAGERSASADAGERSASAAPGSAGAVEPPPVEAAASTAAALAQPAAGGAADISSTGAVDSVFGHLRDEQQGREAPPLEAQAAATSRPDAAGTTVEGTSAGAEHGTEGEAGAEASATGAAGEAAVHAAADAGTGAGTATPAGAAAEASVGPEATAEAEEETAEAEEDVDPALVRRDDLLAPLVASLARRLKRALKDDQNDILDRLRNAGRWSEDVLSPEDEHLDRYRQAAGPQLLAAARAGVAFLDVPNSEVPPVGAIADELAAAVVVPLRRRLLEAAAVADDDAAVADHVGSAYREWRGARVERLAGDHAVAAFSLAVLHATPSGGHLRWVVDDDGIECPDCDDNAWAGPVEAGDEYPTGHRHPPAHAGCRCLLAPVTP